VNDERTIFSIVSHCRSIVSLTIERDLAIYLLNLLTIKDIATLLESFKQRHRRLTHHSLVCLSTLRRLLPNAIPLTFGFPKGGPLEDERGEGPSADPFPLALTFAGEYRIEEGEPLYLLMSLFVFLHEPKRVGSLLVASRNYEEFLYQRFNTEND